MKYPRRQIQVSKLVVNPENPRFKPVEDEQEAIDLMLSKIGNKVLKLARHIVKNGLNPSKALMVTGFEKGRFISLEGNRRIIALKLLDNPRLASNSKYRIEFEKLANEAQGNIPDAVDCIVFPDMDSAAIWVNLEHTGQNKGVGVVDWNAEQTSRFASRTAGKGISPTLQVMEYAEAKGIGNQGLDTSTLKRIISTPAVRQMLGINIASGKLEIEKPEIEVVENLRKTFKAMTAPSFRVGDVYYRDDRVNWVEGVLSNKDQQTEQNGNGKSKKVGRKKKQAFDNDWIKNDLCKLYTESNRVKQMLLELRNLKPGTKPNVCATSLRVLLELVVYEFLDNLGVIKELIEKEKKHRKKLPPNWSPSFQKTLSYLKDADHIVKSPHDRNSIGLYINKNANEPFLAELNQFIHNPGYEPNSATVIEIWKKLGNKLFRAIIEYDQESSHK